MGTEMEKMGQLRAMGKDTIVQRLLQVPRTTEGSTGWELRVYTCGKEILGAGARHFEGGKMEMASEQSGFMRVAVDGACCTLWASDPQSHALMSAVISMQGANSVDGRPSTCPATPESLHWYSTQQQLIGSQQVTQAFQKPQPTKPIELTNKAPAVEKPSTAPATKETEKHVPEEEPFCCQQTRLSVLSRSSSLPSFRSAAQLETEEQQRMYDRELLNKSACHQLDLAARQVITQLMKETAKEHRPKRSKQLAATKKILQRACQAGNPLAGSAYEEVELALLSEEAGAHFKLLQALRVYLLNDISE